MRLPWVLVSLGFFAPVLGDLLQSRVIDLFRIFVKKLMKNPFAVVCHLLLVFEVSVFSRYERIQEGQIERRCQLLHMWFWCFLFVFSLRLLAHADGFKQFTCKSVLCIKSN